MSDEDNKPDGPPELRVPEALLEQSRKNAEERRQQKKAIKEQQRLNLWRSRVHLIREARERFAMKDYPRSVTTYEKYFRVLEIIYEAKPNELQVSNFNNSARQKEIVVIVGALWDLVRIYDMSPRFKKRQEQCADKLAEFLPFTPIYAEVCKKIREHKKNAKNKDIFEGILKKAKKKKGRCFIATAAFEGADHPTVMTLQNYRDEILLHRAWGRAFTSVYYKVSPPIADVIGQSETLKNLARRSLQSLADHVSQKYNLK